MNIEAITGLENVSIRGSRRSKLVYTNEDLAPDNVQSWYRACLAAGKELPFDAVDLVPDVIQGLAALGITATDQADIRGKMPEAVNVFESAFNNASGTPTEREVLLLNAVKLLAAYVGVVGRSY